MRARQLFAALRVYVCPDALSSTSFTALECCLRDGGAELVTDPVATAVTHIVCHPTDYARFADGRNERFYEIVRPAWVFRAFLLQKLLPADSFSANPRLFLSSLAIAAWSIDKDPRKVIDGLIAHFGGQIVEEMADSAGATHVLASDARGIDASIVARAEAERAFCHVQATDRALKQALAAWHKMLQDQPSGDDYALPDSLAAFMGKEAELAQCHQVSFSWIEECVRRRTRVAETPYLLTASSSSSSSPSSTRKPARKPRKADGSEVVVEGLGLESCARVYLARRATSMNHELMAARKISAERVAVMQSALAGAIVLIAQHIPPQLKETMADVLKAARAKVANVPLGDSYHEIVRKVVANASYVVCRYQSGVEYEEAVRQKKKVVSVYWVLAGVGATPGQGGELREALYTPVKCFGGIPEMQNLVVTLSAFSSRTVPTREDVQMAIQATGACVLPVLSRSHSTHLLCYEAMGEKFKKAQSWQFQNILRPDWLLQCIVEWTYVNESSYRIASLANDVVPSSMNESAVLSIDKENPVPLVDDKHEEEQVHPPETHPKKTAAIITTTVPVANARFDVVDLLDELAEGSPKTKDPDVVKPQSGGLAAEMADKLFDTPTDAEKKKNAKKTDHTAATEASDLPDEFEFQFGKKNRARAAKTKANEKSASMGTSGASSPEPEQEVDEGARTSQAVTAAKKPAKKAGATGGRKRKSDATDSKAAPVESENNALTAASEKRASKKSKVAATPAKCPSGSEAEEDALTSTTSNGSSSSIGAKRARSERIFLLTGTREETAMNESIILGLGGKVSQTGRSFDPACTHIICSELKRTEKFVSGCAAGKWILKQSYLEMSAEVGRFVAEDPHEWGPKDVYTGLMDPRIWPQAPGFWRKARADGDPGAFQGWRFLVHAKAVPPPAMCECIVTASGGHVVPLTKSLDVASLAAEAMTDTPVIALITSGLPPRDAWLKKFRAHGLPCINASFLIDYLTKDQTRRPRLEDYAL